MTKKVKSRNKAYKPKPICPIPITWRSNAGTAHVGLVAWAALNRIVEGAGSEEELGTLAARISHMRAVAARAIMNSHSSETSSTVILLVRRKTTSTPCPSNAGKNSIFSPRARPQTAELSYLQHRFTQSYQAYAHKGDFAYSRKLNADRSPDDVYTARGLPPPKPALVGDSAKAKDVYRLGSKGGKTAITHVAAAVLANPAANDLKQVERKAA